MGTNAAKNIRYIKDNRTIVTKRTTNACNWHIWKNEGYQLFLIIATDSVKENSKLYNSCIKNIRRGLINVVIHSELGLRSKLSMIRQGLFPVRFAKRELNRSKKALALDKME
jgi:hypothetical protein